MNPAAAFGLAALVAAAAWRLRALSPSGAAAATLVGTAVLWPLGSGGLLVLGTFFVSATAVSRVALDAAGRSPDREVRDARQVVANGGFAALGALAEFQAPGLGLWLCGIGLAASGGDTWATALGSLSPRPPRDILRWVPVEPGTSGGITWFGCSGGAAGAALIGLASLVAGGPPRLFLTAAVVGTGAMLFDSVLGSLVQARFHCPACDRPAEQAVHRCGTTTQLVRGAAWFDNDLVNAVASGAAVAAGWALW